MLSVTEKKHIVAISGSLRANSANKAILLAIATKASPDTEVILYEGLGELPHYNPELEGEHLPVSVTNLRKLLAQADGVIICTPEYAFSIPGVLKNALDWTVSSGELNEKPVAAISASPLYTGGEKALASLLMTLSALGVREAGSLSIPSVNKLLNDNKEIHDRMTSEKLKALLNALLRTIDPTTR